MAFAKSYTTSSSSRQVAFPEKLAVTPVATTYKDSALLVFFFGNCATHP